MLEDEQDQPVSLIIVAGSGRGGARLKTDLCTHIAAEPGYAISDHEVVNRKIDVGTNNIEAMAQRVIKMLLNPSLESTSHSDL